MASSVEVSVFIDTNLDTHIAMAIFPDITTGDFKRELEREHFICFPKLGEIKVHGLMVRRKSYFYHLPDSLPVKHAFLGLKGMWFLRIVASPINDSYNPCFFENLAAELSDYIPSGSSVTNCQELKKGITCTDMNNAETKSSKRKRKRSMCLKDVLQELLTPVYISKKKKRKRNIPKEKQELVFLVDEIEKKCLGAIRDSPDVSVKEKFYHLGLGNEVNQREEWKSLSMTENLTRASSPVVSVTDIIRRFFPYTNEVNQFNDPLSCCDIRDECIAYRGHNQLEEPWKVETERHWSTIQVGDTPQCKAKTPLSMLSLPLPTDSNPRTSRVKLVRTEVGKHLVRAANNLGISVSKKKTAILFRSKVGSQQVRSAVYEISDSDD